MNLSERQKKYLRGLGHQRKPLIMVGDAGLSESLIAEFEATLAHHELIKVKLSLDDRDLRKALIEQICQHSRAELVQSIGKTVSIYRRNQEKPVIGLPGQ